MPIFNFQCKDCTHEFEHLELPNAEEEKLLTCPSCSSEEVKKLFAPTNVGIQFKATGFYSTDTSSPSTTKSSS